MHQTRHNIIIIIPYFGKLPWYFTYFIHTCRFNQEIDFLIVTDDNIDKTDLPKNVFLVAQSFEIFKKKIRQKLGIPVAIPNTYKLCDFKPAYGKIFSEEISGYQFWGIGDIDVIYGNIRQFITDDILDSNDVITVRYDFLVGYFTLYRNCRKINHLFKSSRDYIKVFTSAEHFCFDECNFAFWKLDEGVSFDDIADSCEIDSMTHVVRRLQKEKKICAYFDTHAIEGLGGKLVWNNGNLIFKGQFEILLYHLILFKKVCVKRPAKRIPNKFRISPTKIYYY